MAEAEFELLASRWRQSGCAEDEDAYVRALAESGQADERLRWAAKLGSEAASKVTGVPSDREALVNCLESTILDRARTLRFGADCVERAVEAYARAGLADVAMMREWLGLVRRAADGESVTEPLKAALASANSRPRRAKTTPILASISLLRAALCGKDEDPGWLAYDACEGALGAAEDVGSLPVGELPVSELDWQRQRLRQYILLGRSVQQAGSDAPPGR